ncbi:MAG TPA: hypothetical protein VF188_09125 [Longimicrobiales bacterium]
MIKNILVGAAFVLMAGCAIRLGGPGPVEYRTVALNADSHVTPEEVAAWIRRTGANLVLLAADADSAWFDEVARRSELALSGPGRAGAVAFAFLAGKPVGDTTVALPLDGGGRVVVHDALYQIDENRFLDLLALRIDHQRQVVDAVRALLDYVATDVASTAAVVLAVDVPDGAVGDSVSALLNPAFLDARACLEDGDGAARSGPGPTGMRLFYGPEARMRCDEAERLAGADSPLVARLIVGR